MKSMKVVLCQDVLPLGTRGDIVTVKSGYARNYLLPQQLAVVETAENIRRIERDRLKFVAQEQAHKKDLGLLKSKLAETSCTIEAKASEEGHLYGSVNAQMIVDAFEKEGVALDLRWVRLEKPIKELGVYEIHLQLHPEIEALTKLWVVESEE